MDNNLNKALISVIICTYNRCNSLKDTLASLVSQKKDDSFYFEIVLVDNNSKDKTKEVTDSFIPEFNDRLRYFFESRQGLSFARNKGIMEAKGEIVAFADDDCILDENWIFALFQTFKKYEADVVGGKILPIWPQKAPKWLFYNYIQGKLSLLNYGDKEFRICSRINELYGCNASYKKSVLVEIGLFNENLGRKGKSLLAGEDTEIFINLLFSQKKIYYQPKAIVHHKILAERMKKSFFRKRCFWGGRTVVKMTKNQIQNQRILRIPRYLFKDLMVDILKWLSSVFSLNYEKRLFHELEIFYNSGRIYEYYAKE